MAGVQSSVTAGDVAGGGEFRNGRSAGPRGRGRASSVTADQTRKFSNVSRRRRDSVRGGYFLLFYNRRVKKPAWRRATWQGDVAQGGAPPAKVQRTNPLPRGRVAAAATGASGGDPRFQKSISAVLNA